MRRTINATTSTTSPTAPPRENDRTTPIVTAMVISPARTRSIRDVSPMTRNRPSGTSISITWANRLVSPIGPAIRGWKTSPVRVSTPVRIAESACANPK